MRILIIGAEGQIGSSIFKRASSSGYEVLALAHKDLDITDEVSIRRVLPQYHPTHIINGAAYNAVDQAEEDSDGAFRINALGPAYLALAARQIGCVLIHYSSDYVFDGTKQTPYSEEDAPHPLSVYGRSKLLGEEAVMNIHNKCYVMRTSWVFAPKGNNFVSRVLKLADTCKELRFRNDLWCAPTYAGDVAHATLALLKIAAPFGIYHAAGSESCTPYEWARKILGHARPHISIEAVNGETFSTKATRPEKPILANTKLEKLGIEIASGISRLSDYFKANN